MALFSSHQQLSLPRFNPKSLALDREQTQKKELTLPTPTITDRLDANPVETGRVCCLCQNKRPPQPRVSAFGPGTTL